ncbi:MAG: hypothetical protein BMS9Abin12_1919 [Acidimicrobiia bacterium]|nr:MAG: hypothetical protein BMS9Abin12_1919 [Acidimicrobiia bacterium]
MRYVAFLRAINTGNRRIKMVDLRGVYVDLGYTDAATYIATGNVIFESDSRPDVSVLESAFEHAFGFHSEVFLRDEDEIKSVLARIPWSDADGTVEVSFLETIADTQAAQTLEATAAKPEALSVSDSEVFFLREGNGAPTTHKESTSTRILGMKMTRRGLSTVQKIYTKFLAEPVTPPEGDGDHNEEMDS